MVATDFGGLQLFFFPCLGLLEDEQVVLWLLAQTFVVKTTFFGLRRASFPDWDWVLLGMLQACSWRSGLEGERVHPRLASWQFLKGKNRGPRQTQGSKKEVQNEEKAGKRDGQ